MADLKLPPKLSIKKAPSDASAPVAVAAVPAPAPAPAPVVAPQPVVAAAPVASAAQPKPIIAAPKLTPKPPMGSGATVTTAKPAAMPLPAMKPATTPPASGIGIKKPIPMPTPMGIKPVTAAKPMPVAAARPAPMATPSASVLAGATASPMMAPTPAKRQTSRVELGVASKTASGSLDVSDLEPLPPKDKDASKPDAKRMTAKISLDAVLAAPDDADSGPKTIRLKRPGEGPTPIKASPIKPKMDTAADDSEDAPKPGTAKIEASEPDAEGGSKRTIRVKRPGGTGTQTSSPSKTPVMDVQLEDLTADSTHWAFVLCGVAAVVVAAINLYVVLASSQGWPWIGSIS